MSISPISRVGQRRPLNAYDLHRLFNTRLKRAGTTAARQTRTYQDLTKDPDNNEQLFALNDVDAANATTGWSIPAARLDGRSKDAYQRKNQQQPTSNKIKFSSAADLLNISPKTTSKNLKEIHCAGVIGLKNMERYLNLLALAGVSTAQLNALANRVKTVVIR